MGNKNLPGNIKLYSVNSLEILILVSLMLSQSPLNPFLSEAAEGYGTIELGDN